MGDSMPPWLWELLVECATKPIWVNRFQSLHSKHWCDWLISATQLVYTPHRIRYISGPRNPKSEPTMLISASSNHCMYRRQILVDYVFLNRTIDHKILFMILDITSPRTGRMVSFAEASWLTGASSEQYSFICIRNLSNEDNDGYLLMIPVIIFICESKLMRNPGIQSTNLKISNPHLGLFTYATFQCAFKTTMLNIVYPILNPNPHFR